MPLDLTALSLDFHTLRSAYAAGTLTPSALVQEVYRRLHARGEDHVWRHVVPLEHALRQARALEQRRLRGEVLPLYGLPYGVKDNIDVAGLPTTAGCAAFAYTAERSADVVTRLDAAGALFIGKQNLDQFATGLVGIRNIDGFCRNAFSDAHVPGGSSSGSAVAVAAGVVSFSIGSDTGGSGRVPAACNHIVGLKPAPGIVSTDGFVYCHREFDVAPVLALTVDDAYAVLAVLAGQAPEAGAAGSRPHAWRIGVPRPEQLEFWGDEDAARLYERSLQRLDGLGAARHEIDLEPFLEAGQMLFGSALVAERWVSFGHVLEAHPEAVHPAVRAALEPARRHDAVDAFRALRRLETLRRLTAPVWEGIDALVLPTCATVPRWADVQADPLAMNARMGRYTYFANPLGLCAISVPAGLRADGLPFGLSLLAPRGHEQCLRPWAQALQAFEGARLGATPHAMPDAASSLRPLSV